MEENRSAVLRAEIRPLPIYLCRIMCLPERVQQLFVTHFRGFKRHLDHFGVSSFIGAHIFVCWIRGLTAAVACGCINNPRNSLKGGFHAPEASGSKCSNLCHGTPPRVEFLLLTICPAQRLMRERLFPIQSRIWLGR